MLNKFSVTSNEIKLYKHLDRLQLLQKGVAQPILLVVSPTNICNQNCVHCCFKDRDKTLEMDFSYLKESLNQFKILGIKSIELAGGGEPTCYSHFNDLVDFVTGDLGLKLGMNTNCVSLDKITDFSKFEWVRLSLNFFDSMGESKIAPIAERIKEALSLTRLSACYIVSKALKTINLKRVIDFSDDIKVFTRIAPDCIQSKRAITALVKEIRPFVEGSEFCFVSDFNIYLNDRQDNFCANHFIKPLLFTDGYVYVCPSFELSKENGMNVSDKFRVCKGTDALDYYTSKFEVFHHSCDYCKYAKQNDILQKVLTKTEFDDFV